MCLLAPQPAAAMDEVWVLAGSSHSSHNVCQLSQRLGGEVLDASCPVPRGAVEEYAHCPLIESRGVAPQEPGCVFVRRHNCTFLIDEPGMRATCESRMIIIPSTSVTEEHRLWWEHCNFVMSAGTSLVADATSPPFSMPRPIHCCVCWSRWVLKHYHDDSGARSGVEFPKQSG